VEPRLVLSLALLSKSTRGATMNGPTAGKPPVRRNPHVVRKSPTDHRMQTSNREIATLQRSVCKAQSLSVNIMKAEILPLQSNNPTQRSEKTIE
jgi:hypothetical protein